MSNKASSTLFDLIKSLSKPEKRYFKIYSSRHIIGEKNNYQILFDAIDKLKEYDEEILKKKFQAEAFVNKFSIAKSRLYDAILKSLDAYHANSSIEAQIKRLIHCAEILYKRSLYSQCSKILTKANKLAEKNKSYTSQLEISFWQKKLIENNNYTETTPSSLDNIRKKDKKYVHYISSYSELWNAKSHLLFTLTKKGRARNQEAYDQYKSIIQSVNLSDSEVSQLPLPSKYLYYQAHSIYFFSIGDYDQCYEHLNNNVKLLDDNQVFINEEPNIYFSLLTNIIYVSIKKKKYKEALKYLEKLRNFPSENIKESNEDLDIKLFSSISSTELTIYEMSGQFDKGLELVPTIEDSIKFYGDKLSNVRIAFLCFKIAILYFGKGEYSTSLKWINTLLNNINIDKSEDIYCHAQLFNLIVHIELDNKRLLPYAFKSASRYLETRNKVFKFESIFLKFIKEYLKSKSDDIAAFQDLYQTISELKEDNYESLAFEYFDFVVWSRSKIENKSYLEIVKEENAIEIA